MANGAGPGDDPLFGDAQGSATAASQDTRNPPRRISSATAAGYRHSFDGEEGDQAAYDSESHAWSLSSLEAAPLEASSVASMDGSDESDPIAGIWHRLSSEEGRRTGHSGAQFPSGFVVDDLQSSSAALPLRAGLAAAASHAASGSRAAVETVHDLHDPMGRGTGARNAMLAAYLQLISSLQFLIAARRMILILTALQTKAMCHLESSLNPRKKAR